MKISNKPLLCILALLFTAGSAGAAPMLDQANDSTFGWLLGAGSSSNEWQQGVTAGTAGLLASIEIHFAVTNTNPTTIYINRGSGWQSDTNDFETVINPGDGWYSIDVSAGGIVLSPGDTFSIGVQAVSDSGTGDPAMNGSDSEDYAGGALYLNGAVLSGTDLNFRTYVVPEPGSLALLGLGGLCVLRRRRGI